ncbi:hypothetical protein MTO96_034263, partial [Rhipicephalus appendiculatus]
GNHPLVCIMGEKLTTVHQFPPDEVCDYIFYDSLYKEGIRNLLTEQSTYTESLNTFLSNRRGYRQTTLGVGFAFESRGATAITAISVPYPEVTWAVSFAEDFSELRFTPHVFISIGHYRLDDGTRSVCAIVPQTRHPDDVPSQDIQRDYRFDVSTPMYQLRWLYSNGTLTKGVVSVTLKGRWAHPVNPTSVNFFDACWSEAIPFGSYTEVCAVAVARPATTLTYSTVHHAMITYVPKIDRTFTYDDERAFAEKLCRVKALGTDVPFGIAAYDLDYDDYYNKCNYLNIYGAHSRLKALRRVVDYFENHTAPFNETACRTFVTV